MARLGVGVDVSKKWLDVASTSGAEVRRVANSVIGLDELRPWLEEAPVHRVVLEASGGYESVALAWLHAAGFSVVLVEPLRARQFARGMGRRARPTPSTHESSPAWPRSRWMTALCGSRWKRQWLTSRR